MTGDGELEGRHYPALERQRHSSTNTSSGGWIALAVSGVVVRAARIGCRSRWRIRCDRAVLPYYALLRGAGQGRPPRFPSFTRTATLPRGAQAARTVQPGAHAQTASAASGVGRHRRCASSRRNRSGSLYVGSPTRSLANRGPSRRWESGLHDQYSAGTSHTPDDACIDCTAAR